jgi:cell wall-associated NlpC family hydrolase
MSSLRDEDIDVRRWLGIPFLRRGTDPLVGLDCRTLMLHVARARGLQIPDFPEDLNPTVIADPVQPPYLNGDIIVVQGADGIRHVGTWVRGKVLTSVEGPGVILLRFQQFTQRGLLGVYRLRAA